MGGKERLVHTDTVVHMRLISEKSRKKGYRSNLLRNDDETHQIPSTGIIVYIITGRLNAVSSSPCFSEAPSYVVQKLQW